MELPMVKKQEFYAPSQDTLKVLGGDWICSFSGGKDSTTLVTYIEWLRCKGHAIGRPRLIQSDTEVEYPFLQDIASGLKMALAKRGWQIQEVRPLTQDKLYNSIFGRGVAPIHPAANRKMRWCTRATKVKPMEFFAKSLSDKIIMLTGLRWGESRTRDGKLKMSGCAAGGECGMPPPGKRTYGPIVTWTLCQVLDWLNGWVSDTSETISDLVAWTRKLVKVYSPGQVKERFFKELPLPKEVSLRFGCIGCPAVTTDKVIEANKVENPSFRFLKRLYWVWDQLRLESNRVKKLGKDGRIIVGPVRMEARKKFFSEILKIQKQAGVVLVSKEDVMFVKKCWRNKIYPRGWNEKHELAKIVRGFGETPFLKDAK